MIIARTVSRAALALLAVPFLGNPLAAAESIRIATYNASLNRSYEGQLIQDLSTPADTQAAKVAEIIQRIRPDILLINEFDFDEDGTAARLFQENYLSVSRNGAAPIVYPYRFQGPSNTGVLSGHDLDNDGVAATPDMRATQARYEENNFNPEFFSYANDSFGFGVFPGQYGMLVLSRYPIATQRVRTFRELLWKDMPSAFLPGDPDGADPTTPVRQGWYSEAELDVVRLSSKSHWDIPVQIGDRLVHVLASHPTPPVFDGTEDRNGTRNHDEIRFWADYLTPARSAWIQDDNGRSGGLWAGALFVIMGDLNADPEDGDSTHGAITRLTRLTGIAHRPRPSSRGAVEASLLQGGVNADHRGDPAFDTGDFGDALPFGPGNLRVDYVLPASRLSVLDAQVFWPRLQNPLSALLDASDHRPVWVDVSLPSP